ncbi:hypothetical protein [Amycolatopsis sp. EV170708-02-1]|uniref:hypothetical protein n=1 Tax=Amycolatopsis sp. EV170708-02-1 TaxID=2919322 RepID=UPI001F0B7D39|nr:hypothetical protein [Amycolatopsis sp. EV170708-02-1]UMP01273.1 hypothetical protein MJQ72_33270 [Amycolatopsis sp. EV170708-02-1]
MLGDFGGASFGIGDDEPRIDRAGVRIGVTNRAVLVRFVDLAVVVEVESVRRGGAGMLEESPDRTVGAPASTVSARVKRATGAVAASSTVRTILPVTSSEASMAAVLLPVASEMVVSWPVSSVLADSP